MMAMLVTDSRSWSWTRGGLALLTLCAAAPSSACSSSEEPAAACAEYAPPEPTAASSALTLEDPVSFRKHVLPIFAASCTFGSCHGSKSAGNNGIYLGSRGSVTDAASIRAALLETGPAAAPSLRYVTPSNHERSYLWVKLTGRFCDVPECADGKCGQAMPRGGDTLEPTGMTTVRSWIEQGAKDD